jgi:hypothetical protein
MAYEALKKYIDSGLPGALTYQEYRDLIHRLHEEGKVTGHEQSDSLLEYSKLNEHRMNRWDKHFKMPEGFQDIVGSVTGKQYWLVVTEGWCGDSAQLLPGIEQIARLNPTITLRVVLRDDNPTLMDELLTNGKRAIPILVCLDETGTFVWKWGPRPAKAEELVQEHKHRPNFDAEEMKKDLHLWYARNGQGELLHEMKSVLETKSQTV